MVNEFNENDRSIDKHHIAWPIECSYGLGSQDAHRLDIGALEQGISIHLIDDNEIHSCHQDHHHIESSMRLYVQSPKLSGIEQLTLVYSCN